MHSTNFASPGRRDRWAMERSSSARAPSPSRLQGPTSASEAEAPPDLLSLLSQALEMIRLKEAAALTIPVATDLTLLSLSAVKVCQMGVASMMAAEGAPQPSWRSDSFTLLSLKSYISRATETLSRLVNREPNYFGVFKVATLMADLRLCEEAITSIVDDMENSYQRRRLRTRIDDLMPDPTARRFWEKHFGDHMEAGWDDFSLAFTREYGTHPQEAMDRLQHVLVTAHEEGGGDEMECDGDGLGGGGGGGGKVQALLYGRLTTQAKGIYELFQEAANPGTMVYVMGTVEDDNHRPINTFVPAPLETFLGISIAQVCCGGQHAAILTTSGLIYTWGRGGFGRLGHGDDAMCATPKLVKELADVAMCRQVCCGFAYTAAVTVDGQVYTWGAGENGRLGLGDEQDKVSPKHVTQLANERVKEVFAGSVHTCALLENGMLYSWGKSEYTGHGLLDDVWSPMALDGFKGQAVVQVSVGPGGYHTIALCSTGQVYTWGHNRVGQLGYSNTDAVPRNVEGAFFLPTPRLVESLQGLRVVKVVAGWGHSAAVCQNGDVYTCGRNFQGQLGLGDPNTFERNERNHPFLPSFRVLHGLKGQRVTQFACGGEHSAALVANDDVYCWGSGSRGQLGHGESRNEHYPRLNMAMRKIRRSVHQVACGNNCTVLLVGRFRIPKLQELCIDALVKNPSLCDQVDLEELLPPELMSMYRRLRGDPVEAKESG